MLKLFNELIEGGVSTIGAEIAELFDEPLNPVAKVTQKKVLVQL
jgi:hypothetical protein